jgi:hypothetical protein
VTLVIRTRCVLLHDLVEVDDQVKEQLVRHGAVAVTIPERIHGFRGYRQRWWPREAEQPFPDWRTA